METMKTTATDEIGELLKRTKTIAVVGLSDSPLRPSYGVSAYMQSQGYKIIPGKSFDQRLSGRKGGCFTGRGRREDRYGGRVSPV